jgi:prophage regulatory protein
VRILRLPEVIERSGLSRASIYRGAGNFPRPVKLTARAVGWYLHEVEAWIESRGVSQGVRQDTDRATQ